MTKLRNIIAGGMIFLSSLLPMKKAEAQKINLSINYSKYIYWAIPFSQGYVHQSTLTVEHKDLTAGAMLNIDRGKINEVDILGNLTKSLTSKIKTSLGFVYFAWNNPLGSWENIVSGHIGASANIPLNPAITIYKSFIDANGKYIEAKVSKDFEIIKNRFSISTSAILGYNDKSFRANSGFSHLESNVSFPVKLSKNLTLTPSFKKVKSLAKDIPNGNYFGINTNYNIRKE